MINVSKDQSVDSFAKIIAAKSSQGTQMAPLFNVVFLAGAGFSKSWDQRYPKGSELFQIEKRDIRTYNEKIDTFLSSHGYPIGMQLDDSHLKDLVYNLSVQKRYPVLRTRYIDVNNISIILNDLISIIYKRFSDLMPINYFDPNEQKFAIGQDVSQLQSNILNFFQSLSEHEDASTGIPSGVRFHFVTTNYDFTLETILDNAIYNDDSIFNYIYRGFTPLKIHGLDFQESIHDHFIVRNLIKINGGFEIYPVNGGYELDYLAKESNTISKNPPKIILPTREQEYNEPYFSSIFPKAVRLLRESDLLVIVGYSMPEEDAMLRFLIKQYAEDLGDAAYKFVFYIDQMDLEKQKIQLSKVFPYLEHDTFKHSNVFLYQGDFAEWAGEAKVAIMDALKKKFEKQMSRKKQNLTVKSQNK